MKVTGARVAVDNSSALSQDIDRQGGCRSCPPAMHLKQSGEVSLQGRETSQCPDCRILVRNWPWRPSGLT